MRLLKRVIGLMLALLLGLALMMTMTPAVHADGGYSQAQLNTIQLIYNRCDFYSQQAGFRLDCRTAFYKAWEETRYGATIYGDYNRAGIATSRGVYQWHAGPNNDCVNGGAACSGPYFQRYGLDWRENLWMDVDRAVDMLTSAQRGGPNYCAHWRICGGVPLWYVQPARPGVVWTASPTSTPEPEEQPEALPTLRPSTQARLGE